jgi:hypothetical protein
VIEEAPAPVVERRRSGLAIAGAVVGAVVVAGALFGGGVLVGTHLPQGSQSQQFGPGGNRPQGGFPGRPGGMGGTGPVRPGQSGSDDAQP